MRNGKILRVWIETKVDDCPDTSYLGKYSDTTLSKWAIDRLERGELQDREYRYFIPANHCPPGNPDNWEHVTDEQIRLAMTVAGLSPLENRAQAIKALDLHYIQQDYQRMESFGHSWHHLGLIAKAEIQTGRNSVIQTIRSGGLWGIESDSDQEYLDSVKEEELIALRDELRRLGFSEKQIDKAFSQVKGKLG